LAGGAGSLDPPAAVGSLGPNLAIAGGELVASWIEPVSEGHRLRFSRLSGDRWSTPVTISEGDDFFANWADFPEVVDLGEGALMAHWLAKTAADTYAYSIFLARSDDGGASWQPFGRLNDDDTPTEHGFVSFVREQGAARAFWLDGRATVEGGPMSLRTALVGSQVGPAEVLDRRICDCCSTDAAVTAAGPVVVYRDRSKEEIRDISLVRRTREGWASPEPVSADGWRIEGCPVNGPEIAVDGERATVAWFTAGGDRPTVRLAFSVDSAATFAPPLLVAGDDSMGRVDVVLDDDGSAWVSWLSLAEDPSGDASEGKAGGAGARVRLRRFGPEGPLGEDQTVAVTAAGRSSGVPRLERLGDVLYLAWVEVREGSSRIRLRRFSI